MKMGNVAKIFIKNETPKISCKVFKPKCDSSSSCPKMNCTPKCTYFPNMECRDYTTDEFGIKHRADQKEYICGYDGHTIKSWYDICPMEADKSKFLKEKRNGKLKRL